MSLLDKNLRAKIKEIFWPIEREELKLFLPMALMMMCVLFNFGALRSVKDGLVVPSIGAEVISFLKLWVVLPSAVIFTIIYVKLSNLFNAEQVFYIITSFFLAFFFVFAYIIYPEQDFYHPDSEFISTLANSYPHIQWFIRIIGKWSYALMYVFSELWSVVVINLMFWQFANHIFDTEKAKRFYPILGMIGNIGLILAGNALVTFSDLKGVPAVVIRAIAPNFSGHSEIMLKLIISAIIFAGLVAMILFRYINVYVLKDEKLKQTLNPIDNTKTTLSLSESFRLIAKSKYIGHIVILVLCYGLLINILEGPWKAKVRTLYPNTVDYIHFMGNFNIWMGISCVTFMILGGNLLRRFSWLIAAMTTPLMIAITGSIFFIFVIFAESNIFASENFCPLYAAVLVGALQNILSKSTKYSLFDSTKEMAYIPLSLELRTKGKAAVEVICFKFGKSLGAVIQSSIFILVPTATFDSITGYLLVVFVLIVMVWFWDVKQLNKEYLKIQKNI